ncbi:hypothetical protein BU25DRAFT_296122, partial [Macroventuria anomochaeta]
STSPPRSGLLTPPSTGGVCKQEPFARPQEAHNSNRRQTKVKEGETLTEFFEDYNEGSDIEIDNGDRGSNTSSALSGNSSQLSVRGSSTAATTISTASVAPAPASLHKSDLASLVVSATTSKAVEPFPFLKLPLPLRNKIYEHLLVVPAIICVRQKHTAYHDERKALLYTERRELLPGIAYALAQVKVDGLKTRFSRLPGININILRTSKEVFNEARAVMYSKNDFEVVKPTDELTPLPDYSIPLFPSGYQRLVTKLNIRIRTFYDLDWLLSGGYNVMKKYYRGLDTLTLVLEMDAATKGFGHQWARKSNEKWTVYIKRLRNDLTEDLIENSKSTKATSIPVWINLRVLFGGEAYASNSQAPIDIVDIAVTNSIRNEQAKREELRSALVETFELFKKGSK